MNIIKIEQFGEIEAIKLGYGPIGPPFMSVYFYILDGLVIDTGQRHMQKTVIELLREKKLRRILLTHLLNGQGVAEGFDVMMPADR